MKRRRSKIDRAVRELAAFVPVPWDRLEFANRLAHWLGRPVYLKPETMAPGTHSLVLDFGTHYDIYYDKHDCPDQADLSILHEVGHIVLGHALSLDQLSTTDCSAASCRFPPELQAAADDFAAQLFTRISSTLGVEMATEIGRIAAILR